MARMWCRRAGASDAPKGARVRATVLLRRAAIGVALAAVLVVLGAVAARAQESGASPGVSVLPTVPDVIRVQQSLTVSFGRLLGSRDGFLRHEEGRIPSLNPDVRLSGELLLRASLPRGFRLEVQSVTGDKPSNSVGLAYGDWSVRIGPRAVNLARAGLSYARWTSGAALLYEPGGATASGPALEVVAARTTSRTADVTLPGDDSFGPYFLGYRRIIPQSEQIFLDGRLQRRGAGPGDGDYYMDYQGGFVYFNKVVLSHQRLRAVFQYEVDDPALSSEFWAVTAAYETGSSPGGSASAGAAQPAVALRGFFLRDHLPVETNSVLQQSGSTLTVYGLHVESSWDRSGWGVPAGGAQTAGVRGAGGFAARLLNTVIVTDLQRFSVHTIARTHQFSAAEGQREYRLPHRPVLYQSEQVTVRWGVDGLPDEPLVRHLDYTVNYQTGIITFAFDLPPGSRVTVRYQQVADGARLEEERSGFETRHRLEYRGERWLSTSWLDLADDGFVQPATLRPPETRLSAGTVNEYRINEAWSLLGELTVTERQQRVVYRPAAGAGYESGPWSGRVRLVGTVVGGWETLDQDYRVDGQLRWRGPAELGFEFARPLRSGGALEWYRLAAVGVAGRLPYSVTFTHGDEQYADKLEARVTVPGAGLRWRGSVTAALQLLYPGALADEPRTVQSLLGNIFYTGADGTYVRLQGAGATSRWRTTAVHSGTLVLDAGRSLGRAVVLDYQLRGSLSRTVHDGAMVEGRRSLSHVATVAVALSDRVSGAVVYRWSDGSRERAGRGATVATEQGWQATLNVRWTAAWSTNLTYDRTRSVTVGAAVPLAPGSGSRAAETRRWQLTAEFTGEVLSFRLTGTTGRYDETRLRRSLEVRPAYRLSEHAEWWVSYVYVDAHDAARPAEAYAVHEVRTGITFRL